jgi:hypothetical protein
MVNECGSAPSVRNRERGEEDQALLRKPNGVDDLGEPWTKIGVGRNLEEVAVVGEREAGDSAIDGLNTMVDGGLALFNRSLTIWVRSFLRSSSVRRFDRVSGRLVARCKG